MIERNTENEIGSTRHSDRELTATRAIFVIDGVTDKTAQMAALKRQGITVCNVHAHRLDEPCNDRCASDVKVDA